MKNLICLFITLVIASGVFAKPKIVWISNLTADVEEESGFWNLAHTFITAAAKDLDVDFQIIFWR